VKHLILLLSIVFLQSCASREWKENVLDACINDYQRHSYFVSLQVRTETGVVRCLVRTGYLFLYFKHRQGLNEKEYANLAKSIIKDDRIVEVSADDRERYNFVMIYECDETKGELEKKDTDYILDKYFNKVGDWYLFKGAATAELKNEIIDVLFERHVIVTTGDEAGVLVVPGWQFR
jgi:hypothetical protein